MCSAQVKVRHGKAKGEIFGVPPAWGDCQCGQLSRVQFAAGKFMMWS
jgi:hypothetical protein